MARHRLLAVPYAGGGPFSFLHWARRLPPHVELLVVSAPGRDLRDAEPEEPRLDVWLACITDALLSHPALPLTIYGHSLGALIGFAVARRLAEEGRTPRHVIVGAKAPPGMGNDDASLADLPDAELLAELGMRFGGLPRELLDDDELRATLAVRLRNDLRLLAQVRAPDGPRLACPLTVCWSPDDATMDASQLAPWARLVSGEVRYHAFGGGHFFLNAEADAVCRLLGKVLDDGTTPGTGPPG
jgi:surfactin synthase thioesterase subunit